MIRHLAAEAVGTFFLLATVVGSGIMAENLAGGNIGIALLGNTIATGAMLFVLITFLGPISGAHFNPAVTFIFWLKREKSTLEALMYILIQLLFGLLGTFAAHLMFALDIFQVGAVDRGGFNQWVSELIATMGLLLTILGCLKTSPKAIPAAVGLYISAAYWFTASTSFANPAVTIARGFTNTFSGIDLSHVPMFILSQFAGATVALLLIQFLFSRE